MLVPFPWKIYSLRQLLSIPQTIVWYILIPFIIIGITVAIRFKIWQNFAILTYLFIITSVYALVEGNVGSAFRHRDLVLPFYLIYAAVGIAKVFGWRVLSEQRSIIGQQN